FRSAALALRAFPTRRSSDLGLKADMDEYTADRLDAHSPGREFAQPHGCNRVGADDLLDDRRKGDFDIGSGRSALTQHLLRSQALDRKSTRLNSSHRTTSYAV